MTSMRNVQGSVLKFDSVKIKISCWGRENSVCKYLDRVQSGLFDMGKLFKMKIILLCFKIFSIAGNKITLSQSETGGW